MPGSPPLFPGSRRPGKPRREQREAAGRPGENGCVEDIFETSWVSINNKVSRVNEEVTLVDILVSSTTLMLL